MMTAKRYPHLTRAFETTIIEKFGDYPYPISPFAGVTKPISPELMAEFAQAALSEKKLEGADLIVTFESAGAQLAAIAGQALPVPYIVARKKKFSLPKEISFSVITNFDEKKFYIYGDVMGKRILIIDVIASGTTVKNAALALKEAGGEVIAIFVAAAKTNMTGKKYQDTLVDINIPLVSLVQIKVVDNKVVVLSDAEK